MKTNFEKITESPESLAEFIAKQYGYSQIKEEGNYFNLLQWFKWSDEQIYENEEHICDTCKHYVNQSCSLEGEGCQTEMWECYESKVE
jgi:hypothetical protein